MVRAGGCSQRCAHGQRASHAPNADRRVPRRERAAPEVAVEARVCFDRLARHIAKLPLRAAFRAALGCRRHSAGDTVPGLDTRFAYRLRKRCRDVKAADFISPRSRRTRCRRAVQAHRGSREPHCSRAAVALRQRADRRGVLDLKRDVSAHDAGATANSRVWRAFALGFTGRGGAIDPEVAVLAFDVRPCIAVPIIAVHVRARERRRWTLRRSD